ncbi:hypothetical protein [Mangrovimonas yunxiaonensis]|nr:hypothetical protein [Mangrovimonas yunxiaonensis]
MKCTDCDGGCGDCFLELFAVTCSGGTGNTSGGDGGNTSGDGGTIGSGDLGGTGTGGTGGGDGPTDTSGDGVLDGDHGGDETVPISTSPIGVNEPSDKDDIIDCLGGAGSLTLAQQNWLNNASEVMLKKMATAIKKSGCSAVSDIILDYIDNNETQDFDDYVDEELECYYLNELTDNAYFQNALNDLQNYIEDTTETNEQGFEVSFANNVLSTNFKEGSYDGVKLNHGGNITGGMHTHPDQGNPMFSGKDVYKLFKYCQSISYNTNSDSNVNIHNAFSVVTTPNGTYMIKVRDYNALRYLCSSNVLGNNSEQRQDRLDVLISSGTYGTSNENDYLREFLTTFEDIAEDYGLSKSPLYLYKLNTTDHTFEKVNLDANNQPEITPCN